MKSTDNRQRAAKHRAREEEEDKVTMKSFYKDLKLNLGF